MAELKPSRNRADQAPTPEEERRELQAILGQLHGLLSSAIEMPEYWCPPELVESLTGAYNELGGVFGSVQAELNTGLHDSKLPGVGLAGEQMKPKKMGFWRALAKFFNPRKNGSPPFFGALGSATRWGGIIVGSLSREIPGAEVIKEFIETVHAGQEQFTEVSEASATPPASKPGREAETAKERH